MTIGRGIHPDGGFHPDGDWARAVLAFWFGSLAPKDWFAVSEDVDRGITERFSDLYAWAASRSPALLAQDAPTVRAAIIVLDQFPRNMFRGSARAFATDALALELARTAVARDFDRGLTVDEAVFVYIPFEHSEDLADQERAVRLISGLGDKTYTDYALRHRDVIKRFGRFPHRNAVLGRTTTPVEAEFLAVHPGGF
ncbi:MAG: DUF924 family protein [Hyphomicrobiaceae bacterium]